MNGQIRRARWPLSYCLGVLLISLGGCAMAPDSFTDGIAAPADDGDAAVDAGPVLGPTGGEDDTSPPLRDDDSEAATDGEDGSTEEGDETPDGGDIQSGTLTAGSFDDNLNLDSFREFVSSLLQTDTTGELPDLTLGNRVIITVLDTAGEPVGNARVVVSAADSQQQVQPLIDIQTRSDGRALFSTGVDGANDVTAFSVTVYSTDGSSSLTVLADLTDLAWDVTLPGVEAHLPAQLDLAFVVDATGSMSDELEYLKVEMDGIVSSVSDGFPDVDQRYALVVYRDDGDEYVTRTFDFTESLSEFQVNLSNQRAQGGGDYPEAMHEALEEAQGLTWRGNDTARVLFLIADAPPHGEFAQRTLDATMGLRFDGVAIYPVAASGVAEEAEFIMRTAALLTVSEYCFLTDDSGVGNPHAEPNIPCYTVQRLDQLMIRLISSELAGQRLYPEPEDIIRTVGNPVNGVCTDEEIPDPQEQ